MKALGCQPVEITSLSKVLVSDVVNLHPYIEVKGVSLKDKFSAMARIEEVEEAKVGRCKLDPSLKATCFQPLNLRVHTVLST